MSYDLFRGEQYKRWHRKLDAVTRRRMDARIGRAVLGHFGDHKNLGEGLFEMRFDFAHGYRVYYGFWRGLMLLLLAGGDKSTQQADIGRAREELRRVVVLLDEEDRKRKEEDGDGHDG